MLADVTYYEPWWMQILKSLVIFFVVFNLVPIVLLGERKLLGRFQGEPGHLWFFIPQFFGFIIFVVAGFAETNRAPFDLAEADAELVGGYNTEYGGGRFAAYYLAE